HLQAAQRRVVADQRERALVVVEQAVPPLWLVRRIAHIGLVAVDEAGVGMGRALFAVPGPEVAAVDLSAAGPRCLDLVVDRPVVAVRSEEHTSELQSRE